MPNIRPVSDLRNYNDILKNIKVGDPVFLTKNGRGRYAIIDIAEYEKTKATIELLTKLSEAENVGQDNAAWLKPEDIRKNLGV